MIFDIFHLILVSKCETQQKTQKQQFCYTLASSFAHINLHTRLSVKYCHYHIGILVVAICYKLRNKQVLPIFVDIADSESILNDILLFSATIAK